MTNKKYVLILLSAFIIFALVSAATKPPLFTSKIQLFGSEEYFNDTQDLININTAVAEELMVLTGIGEVKANAIIHYRTNYGEFKHTSELLNVKGITAKIYAAIEAYICI